MKNIKYAILGILFGIVFVKAEIISWFRIQEMFRFQSFHMFGVIGSAIAVGMISIFLIKKYNARSAEGEQIHIEPKKIQQGPDLWWFIVWCRLGINRRLSGTIVRTNRNRSVGDNRNIIECNWRYMGVWTYQK